MPKFIEVEAWVIVDADENYVVAHDSDTAAERYDSDVGSDASTARRTIRVTLKVPVPQVVEATIVVPEESSEVAVSVG